jgi:ABC-type multidrug transport system fused ATPase/permease subunit
VRLYDIWPLSYLKKKRIALPIKLLSRRDQILLTSVIFITIFLAMLDLFGVLLIGVVGSLSVTGISSNQVGNRVSFVLDFLNLNNLDFENQVAVVGLLAATLMISKTLLTMFIVKKTMFFMARRAAAMSSQLISKYFTISVSRINRRSAQNSIYALTTGVSSMMLGVIGVSIELIADITLLGVMGIGLFIVDPITALSTSIIYGLLAFILYKSMHKKMEKLGEEQGLLDIESSQRIYEAIYSYRELLVRDRRGYYARQIGNLRFRLADGSATIKFMANISKYILEITLVISALLLAYYQFSTTTAFRAIGTITIFIAASTRITPAILRLQQGILGMRGALAQAKPTISLIEELRVIPLENFRAQGLSRIHSGFVPEAQISGVSFSYETSSEVLKQISFESKSGEFVAIVGESGAGKTTLADIILGALEAQSGEVKISGLPPKTVFSKWPGAVSYVPQDSPVIHGTIRENLALGYPTQELLDEYCWESLRQARLDELVRSLPNQLETYVGDRGTRLSGGQRQRLGIARALITNPKLLILDEATSSLDGVTESEIAESLRSLKGEVTLIVIAHRLSTIVSADRIYYLEAGRVKGIGTFNELKNAHPKFFEQARLMGL